MTGFSLSITVTLNVVLVLLLAVSVAVQVTVVGPIGKVEPEGGRQATLTPGQLSCAAGRGKLTTALVLPGSVFFTMSAGWVMVGRSPSAIVTLKLHVAVLPEVSVAVQLTVVTPTGKTEPEAGTQATVTPGTLSVAVTV